MREKTGAFDRGGIAILQGVDKQQRVCLNINIRTKVLGFS